MAYPLIGTFPLTGGRFEEVLGLMLRDVNQRRGTVTFHWNRWRRQKSDEPARTVPFWPQIREILEPWIEERRQAGAGPDA